MAAKSRGRSSASARRTSSSKVGPDDAVTRYARQAVDGEIVVGELVRYAAERHLRDLVDGPARGIHWSPDSSGRILRFMPAIFSITAGALAGQPFVPLPWHAFAAGSLFGWKRDSGRLRFRNAWLETGKGQAKALALDTPIPTPSGWTTMGQLRDGDHVLDDRGKPCRVVRAHPVVEGQQCYRVRFDDGAEIVANAGHLWRTEMRKSGSGDHGAATRGVPLRQRGGWRQGIRTTQQISESLTYPNGRYASANHSVPLATPLDLPAVDLPVDPYALGAWLGDGDSDCARLTVGDADAVEMRGVLAGRGITLTAQSKHPCRYRMGYGSRWGARVENLSSQLRGLGVYGNKHIPAAYLRASFDQRLAMLQGLMDTDGSIAEGGQCCFGVTNERLAAQTMELALSLGLKATMHAGPAKIDGRVCGTVYRVRFYAPEGTPVFRLGRKLERQKALHSRRRLSGERRIVACDPTPSVAVRCITVDSPSSMFLCGREMIPTHNSPLIAALGLYMMGWHGIRRSEVYSIGWDKRTANVLFADAVSMCRAQVPGREEGETLENLNKVIIRGVLGNAWKIEHPDSESFFQALANTDNVSGPRPSLVGADEIHEFKDDAPLRTWRAAVTKQPGDALIIMGTNTPASTQIVGTQYSEFYQHVARGEALDDQAFSFIARVDEADRETVFENEGCWQKALPALGVTFPLENIRGEVASSRENLATAMSTKRLYFGIPTGAISFWIAEQKWSAVQGEVDEDEMVGKRCALSLDLSDKNDLTALTACWDGEKDGKPHLWAKTWYWTTKDGLHERALGDNAPYELWVAQGRMTAIDAPIIDKEFVAVEVRRLVQRHNVEMLAFDPAGIADFIKACDDIQFPVWRRTKKDTSGTGLMLVSHAQGNRVVFDDDRLCMPLSIERFEDVILNGEITIDDSPVTYMCAANAAVVTDAQNNRAFDKRRSRGRIDGLVTNAMAVGAVRSSVVPGSSVYATRGALVL